MAAERLHVFCRVSGAARALCALFLISFLCLATAPSAAAQEVQPARLDAAERTLLAEVERYLNGISSLRANFVQVAPDGAVSEGIFLLRRPGRLRVEYAPPVPVLIVGDGVLLHYHDKELGQINEWPVFDTPLGVLAGDELRFDEGLTVTAFTDRGDHVEIGLILQGDPGAGRLSLILEQNPLVLRRWRVTDAQGLVTTVSLFDLETNIALAAKLFVFDDPREIRSPR